MITVPIEDYKKALAEIDRLKAEREWISVKDRLPKEHLHRLEFVLVCKENGVVLEAKYNTKTKEFLRRESFETLNHTVTHWMPLPTPPDNSKYKE